MKTAFLIVFLISLSYSTYGQQDARLPGIVVEQNSKFNTGKVKYISNAQIKSPGAQPQLSAGNGSFALIFADKPGGNLARVYVSKNGYQTVNEEELKKAAVLGRKIPLKIVLCKEGQLYENQLTYYQIAKGTALDAYEKRVAILKQEGKEKDLLIAELETKFNEQIHSVDQANELLRRQLQDAEQQAKSLADKWVTINLDDMSATYQLAFKAFMAKDIDGALNILNKVGLEERLKINVSEKDKEEKMLTEFKEKVSTRNEQIHQDIEQCILKARLHVLKYEFDKVEELYELALRYDNNNPEILLEYATFLQKQNHYTKAIKRFQDALSIYRPLAMENPKTYLENLAIVQVNLGSLFTDTRRLNEAERFYQEGLTIYRSLVKEAPDSYSAPLAQTLHNMGNLLTRMNRLKAAKFSYEQSHSIFKKLALESPDLYLPNLATGLGAQAGILYELGELPQAKKMFMESLSIHRQYSGINADRYLPDLAESLLNMGAFLISTGEHIQAQKMLEEALSIYQQLAKSNPYLFNPSVAMTLNNLGLLLTNINLPNQALEHHEQALALQRELAERDPMIYLPEVAVSLNNIGSLYSKCSRPEIALKKYEASLAVYDKIPVELRKTLNLDICMVLINMAGIYQASFNKTNDQSLNKLGLDLMNTAKEKLSHYSIDHPTAQSYLKKVNQLILFFSDSD